jgi:hypothetical protein
MRIIKTIEDAKAEFPNYIWHNGDSAPEDGSDFFAIVNEQPATIAWRESRRCMLAGIGGGNGYFGAGWECQNNRLISDPPEFWAEDL